MKYIVTISYGSMPYQHGGIFADYAHAQRFAKSRAGQLCDDWDKRAARHARRSPPPVVSVWQQMTEFKPKSQGAK